MDFMAMIVSPEHRRNEWVRIRSVRLAGSLWALLALGCSATSDPASGDLRQDLRHKDPRVRMEAAHQAGTKDRADLVDLLVENLRDHDESVRFITAISLRKITGQDFGFRSFASILEREEAIARWRRWAGIPSPPGDSGTVAGTTPEASRDVPEPGGGPLAAPPDEGKAPGEGGR